MWRVASREQCHNIHIFWWRHAHQSLSTRTRSRFTCSETSLLSIATNKRTFFKRLWISGHPSSGCDEIRNEFIKAMGYSCQWILSAFGTNDYQHEEVSCIMTSKKRSSMVKETKGSVAHCSRSQDIALFKFQLSYHSNPLQDTCPITSAVLGHLIRTRVPLMFLNWDKKSY